MCRLHRDFSIENDDFPLKNDDLMIKRYVDFIVEERKKGIRFCIKADEFCINDDECASTMMTFGRRCGRGSYNAIRWCVLCCFC